MQRGTAGQALAKPILWRPLGSMEWTESPSISAAALHLGIWRDGISQCCNMKIRQSNGYEFRFASKLEYVLPGEEWETARDPNTFALLAMRKVSSHGRVQLASGLINWGSVTADGYRSTCVTVNGTRHTYKVHRVVAATFLRPSSTERWQVNHKDGNRSNNHVDNLEYVTPSENFIHANILHGKCFGRTPKPVFGRMLHGSGSWTWYPSMTDAACQLGLSCGISSVCRGRTWHTDNYEFKYAEAQTSQLLPGEEWRSVVVDDG
eukprot:TRINITY_DN26729_c0_g1_i1.p1 TRINITY_DN26729_c0_g1~~TRINITY_DN26729_c0_g1_i1.p1  ORF type:complete len:308 (-),score=27.58 TRINITY_DN26729_c0_g1_i1:304-1092(-)